jgi:flagellar biosynthetic protein FliQ
MTSAFALAIFGQLLKTGMLVCAPLLGLILVTGVIVSILQVVTQIQDAALAFVPKLVVFVVGLLVLGPWMLRQITAFAINSIEQAAAF